MASTDLLLAVDQSYNVKIGLPPSDRQDSFNSRATICGELKRIIHIACSPEGEFFCVRAGDMYRGPLPSNKDVDWFSVARRVGKAEWYEIASISFHPNGDLYVLRFAGELFAGPPPDNEHVSWLYKKARKIGTGWNTLFRPFFDPEGNMYAIKYPTKLYKGPTPTGDVSQWISTCTTFEGSSWGRLVRFMSFTPDGKLWCVDMNNGNLYKGDPPTPGKEDYLKYAEYLGWGYNDFLYLAFTKDKTIQNIISFEFLPDEGKRVSECPEVIEEKLYDNRRSSSILRHTFTFNKTLKESSSFTNEQGFTFAVGVEATVKGGVPLVAKNTMKISMNMSTTHNWSLTKTNETEVTFSTSSNVELEGGKAIRMVASVVKAEINVPYKARARTMFGSEIEIRGMWNGVSHYNLKVTQEDYTK